ncbi:MAG: hypothetical protein EOP83_08635 [Verrucomicrobiaceae bacterium]|nr:MAG: hypothetical protein EOP83_08635 [Verrucomicrobiaceae bacterium]
MNELRFIHQDRPVFSGWTYVFSVGPSVEWDDPRWVAVIDWCNDELGKPKDLWARDNYHIYIRRIDAAFRFKMRWC